MTSQQQPPILVADFIDYCREFYDIELEDSLYPFATSEEIRFAALAHVTDPNPKFPFDGDSFDREAVRDRIMEFRKASGRKDTDFDEIIKVAKSTKK